MGDDLSIVIKGKKRGDPIADVLSGALFTATGDRICWSSKKQVCLSNFVLADAVLVSQTAGHPDIRDGNSLQLDPTVPPHYYLPMNFASGQVFTYDIDWGACPGKSKRKKKGVVGAKGGGSSAQVIVDP